MKQTNNAIKFLMAQYRAIFKNANIAMLAAIAASALAAGQAQAAKNITAWNSSDLSGSVVIGDGDTFEVVGGGKVANETGFQLILSSGSTASIKGNAAGAEFSIKGDATSSITLDANHENAGGDETNATLAIGGNSAANDVASVTVGSINNKLGTITVTGSGASAKSSLNAGTINIGVDSDTPDKALVNVAAFGSLNASSTLEVGEAGKITIGDNAAVTGSQINLNGGKVLFSGSVANTTLGSSDSTIEIDGASIENVDDSHGGSIVGDVTLTTGTIHAKHHMGINGKFNANGGEIKVAATKNLTLKGTANINEGATLSNSGNLIVTGKTTIADNATLTLGDNAVVQITGDDQGADDAAKTSTLTISKATFGTLTNGQNQKIKASGAAGTHAVLSFTDDKINLVDDGIIKSDALDDEKVAIEGAGDFKIFANTMELKNANVNIDKLIVAGNNVTVGTAGSFEVKGGSKLEVGKSLTIDGSGDNKLTITSGGLTLKGAGSVAAKTIDLAHADTISKSTLTVESGEWTVNDLTLTSGTATVKKDGSLTVGSTLKALNTSTMTVNGVLSTVGDGKLNFKEAANNSLKVEAGGTLKLDAGDILTADKKLDKNALKAAALSGAGVVNVVAAENYTMTQEEFQAFRDLLSGSFTGTFNMDFVQVEVPQEQVITTTDIESQLATKAYNEKTLKTNDQGISGNYSVGNIYVDAKSDLNLKGDKAGLVLNNASKGPGAGYFVSKNSDSEVVAGGVVFDTATTNLTLAGKGKIGTITSDSNKKGVVVIGIADENSLKPGHVTVVSGSNIGTSATQGVTKVLLNEGSSLTVESGSVFTNNFNMQEGTSAKVTGDITTDTLLVLGKSLTANNLTLSNTSAGAEANTIAGGANVTLDALTMGKNQSIHVGEAGQAGDANDLGSNAVVFTKSLKMDATSSIFVDPNYGTGASLFATDKIGDNGSTVSGKVGIGSNSAFGVGFASMAEFEETLSPYLTNNGGFDGKGAVKNALVLNKPVSIAVDQGITVDSELKATELDTKVSGNALTLGAGAALIVTNDALVDAGAVQFANGAGKVEAADDGSSLVIFAADVTKQDSGKRVFGANTTVDTALKGQAAGGLLDVAFNTNGTITLTNNDKRLGEMRQHISEPTTQLFADYRDGKFAGAVDSLGYKFVYKSLTAPGDAYKAVDIAAHAATYAGAQQAAVAAVTTMADAMFGRVGAVGVEAATIAATGSQANGGVWLTPMYKSVDSDGFGAQGGSYGADVDLSGVAFGTDTVNGNMRFGAVFNIGSGDTEGKGLGNGLKDEFDYYGFGIYSAMGFGNFALVGDASMTVISHEVEGLGLKGKADTTAVTMGLTGQYTVATPMVDVTPHLGARFIRLNTDSYDLVSADGVLATTDFDVQNVFSVPLGVTLSKAFVAGGWNLAPSADLTIAFNTGDTEAKSSNQFTGIKAYEYSTEVLDEVQYGLTVGLGAQYGAFGTSFGINYTGSDNTDSFGVNAQCRYMF